MPMVGGGDERKFSTEMTWMRVISASNLWPKQRTNQAEKNMRIVIFTNAGKKKNKRRVNGAALMPL